ncbi:MAG TPA: PIN domain-containing protein [Candidatus Thermoplasmatota archaeon]|nr:PIN domain-containing protein [Candidatus Thermoplasmatota archaeon]
MILDASFLVDLLRGDPGARAALAELEKGSEAVRIPAPALAKLAEAMARSRNPPREAARLEALLLAAGGVALTGAHALRAGRLVGEAARDGLAMDPLDAMTAAIALEEGETLVTRAREYERVEGLRVRGY